MNDLPKSPATKHESVREPLVGDDVLDVVCRWAKVIYRIGWS